MRIKPSMPVVMSFGCGFRAGFSIYDVQVDDPTAEDSSSVSWRSLLVSRITSGADASCHVVRLLQLFYVVLVDCDGQCIQKAAHSGVLSG